jgi:hypothetical protein
MLAGMTETVWNQEIVRVFIRGGLGNNRGFQFGFALPDYALTDLFDEIDVYKKPTT